MELPCGDCPSSFRAAGSPEQAPSFYVLSIVVRRAGSTQVPAFFRVEGCLPETCQLLRQNQKAAIRQFPRADIKPAAGLTNTKVSIFVSAFPYLVPARIPLNTKLPVYVRTLPPERFHCKPAFLRFYKKLRHFFPTALHSANGVPRSPVGETHLQSSLTHALPRYADASSNFGMGDAIPLQHGADQFSLFVNNGKRVPLKTTFVYFEAAGLAVTHGVRHGSFIQVSTPQYLQPHKSARRTRGATRCGYPLKCFWRVDDHSPFRATCSYVFRVSIERRSLQEEKNVPRASGRVAVCGELTRICRGRAGKRGRLRVFVQRAAGQGSGSAPASLR